MDVTESVGLWWLRFLFDALRKPEIVNEFASGKPDESGGQRNEGVETFDQFVVARSNPSKLLDS